MNKIAFLEGYVDKHAAIDKEGNRALRRILEIINRTPAGSEERTKLLNSLSKKNILPGALPAQLAPPSEGKLLRERMENTSPVLSEKDNLSYRGDFSYPGELYQARFKRIQNNLSPQLLRKLKGEATLLDKLKQLLKGQIHKIEDFSKVTEDENALVTRAITKELYRDAVKDYHKRSGSSGYLFPSEYARKHTLSFQDLYKHIKSSNPGNRVAGGEEHADLLRYDKRLIPAAHLNKGLMLPLDAVLQKNPQSRHAALTFARETLPMLRGLGKVPNAYYQALDLAAASGPVALSELRSVVEQVQKNIGTMKDEGKIMQPLQNFLRKTAQPASANDMFSAPASLVEKRLAQVPYNLRPNLEIPSVDLQPNFKELKGKDLYKIGNSPGMGNVCFSDMPAHAEEVLIGNRRAFLYHDPTVDNSATLIEAIKHPKTGRWQVREASGKGNTSYLVSHENTWMDALRKLDIDVPETFVGKVGGYERKQQLQQQAVQPHPQIQIENNNIERIRLFPEPASDVRRGTSKLQRLIQEKPEAAYTVAFPPPLDYERLGLIAKAKPQ